MNPDIRKIARPWTEEEYRNRHEISYSMISKYARLGFEGYLKLNDKEESESLSFGSALDCYLTDRENFSKTYNVAEKPFKISGKTKEVLEYVAKLQYSCLDRVNSDAWIRAFDEIDYYSNLPYSSRLNKFKRDGKFIPEYEEYHKFLLNSMGKIGLTMDEYNSIQSCEASIRTNGWASMYFFNDTLGNNEEVHYQLKFNAILNGVGYRCMADAIYINHETKEIIPIDLKTTSKPEWKFPMSFIEWRYDIQARLYWRVINANIKHSKEFYDYKLSDYRFVVVNRFRPSCLVWKFSATKNIGEIIIPAPKRSNIILKDPYDDGRELHELLISSASVPSGIKQNGENDILTYLKKLVN